MQKQRKNLKEVFVQQDNSGSKGNLPKKIKTRAIITMPRVLKRVIVSITELDH